MFPSFYSGLTIVGLSISRGTLSEANLAMLKDTASGY